MNAWSRTSGIDRPAAAATITIGNTSRIPKTAIKMPQVRKICCHFSFIRLRMCALTIALSNEIEISRIVSSTTISPTSGPPRMNEAMIAMIVTPSGMRNVLMGGML